MASGAPPHHLELCGGWEGGELSPRQAHEHELRMEHWVGMRGKERRKEGWGDREVRRRGEKERVKGEWRARIEKERGDLYFCLGFMAKRQKEGQRLR